jgi:hypothetical protein
MVRALQLFSLIVLAAMVANSQAADPAVVTFTFDFPGSQPEHYSIRIHSDGASRYESSGKIAADSDESDNFGFDFTASADIREKVFELAAKAGYFQKDLDSHHKGLAFTGKKVLTYKDARRNGESNYNYSAQPAAQELTSLFQNLSATLEYGRRLHYDHRYQKLALDDELKRMEEESRSAPLVELAAIAPILQEIIGDSAVMNVSRARAQRLLERAGTH